MSGHTIGPWITTITDADKAYIAGFIDGEGTVVIGRRWAVQVSVGQVDPRPLQYIAGMYGGHLDAVARNNPRWRDYWRLTVSGTAALRLLRDIEPYLIVKREQAQVPPLLQAIKRTSRTRPPLTEAEIAERESYRLALLDLRAIA